MIFSPETFVIFKILALYLHSDFNIITFNLIKQK